MDPGLAITAIDRANRALLSVAPGWHTSRVTYPMPPQQQPDNTKKFLNMSGGILAAVIAGVVLLCCVGPIAVCLLGGVLDAATPKPTVTITKCKIDDRGILHTAEIEYTIKNNSTITDSYSIDFAVLDGSGVKVGDGSEYVSDLGAGQTARGSETIFTDAVGGVTCKVAKAD